MQVLTIERIAESLKKLRKLGIHRNMIMYLCVKRAGAEQRTIEDIKIDFREFFERFLTVKNAPLDRLNKPYIIPFESSDANIWLNRNLAGSFAPSSIRPNNPINSVISINGAGANVRYELRHNHGKQAFKNLQNGLKLPVLDLAVFLYRDFGFNSNKMSAEVLLNIFREEFGYLDENGELSPDYDEIYSYDLATIPEDLFTLFSVN